MRAAVIAASALAPVIALLFVPIRVRVLAGAAPLGAEVSIGFSLFGRPVRRLRRIRLVLEGGRFSAYLIAKRGVLRLKKPKRKPARPAAFLPALKPVRLSVSGRVGLQSDAAAAALLAGALGGILASLARIGFALLPAGPPEECRIRILPDFQKTGLSLRAGGIVATDLRKLIKSLFRAYHRTKEKQNAPNRKHHAEFHGADQPACGR